MVSAIEDATLGRCRRTGYTILKMLKSDYQRFRREQGTPGLDPVDA